GLAVFLSITRGARSRHRKRRGASLAPHSRTLRASLTGGRVFCRGGRGLVPDLPRCCIGSLVCGRAERPGVRRKPGRAPRRFRPAAAATVWEFGEGHSRERVGTSRRSGTLLRSGTLSRVLSVWGGDSVWRSSAASH